MPKEEINIQTYGPTKLSPARNAGNAALLVGVALPAIYYWHFLAHVCTPTQHMKHFHTDQLLQFGTWAKADAWCAVGAQHPITMVNIIFFLNVNVLFWIISLLQGSTWLIDPYWTLLPPMIGLFYQGHPYAAADAHRSRVTMALLWTWALRLTHSYFRREGWQFGAREDWRFADLRAKLPRSWWLLSFFVTYVSQQLMLVGVTLPLAAVQSNPAPWSHPADTLAAVTCILGLFIACVADNQLRSYMVENERRRAAGQAPVLLLNQGIWRLSRHPNYFGEVLFHTGMALFAVNLGQPWMVIGTIFNTAVLLSVTVLTEARMVSRRERAALYRRYQATTSCWVPWLPKGTLNEKKE